MTPSSIPSVTFTPLAVLNHHAMVPRFVVLANVQHARDFQHVEPEDALHSGIKLPPKTDLLLLPRDLSVEPAIETLRPKNKDEEIFLPLGFVPLESKRQLCVVFGQIGSDPAKDRVKMYSEMELHGYMHSLQQALKKDPADDTGLTGWLQVLEPVQQMLSHNQARLFPQPLHRLS